MLALGALNRRCVRVASQFLRDPERLGLELNLWILNLIYGEISVSPLCKVELFKGASVRT